MYKTKLQELCQKKQWGWPKYSTMKVGPDHDLRFKASVSVNRQSFHSDPSKSSKVAQNDAAKQAFLHLSSGSSMRSIDSNAGGPNEVTYQDPETQSVALGGSDEHGAAKAALVSVSPDGSQKGDSCLYKNLLQELAQCEGFCLPIYNTTKAGPSHMPMFFSTVKVEEEIFHGKAGKSKKQAELNAAKVAYSFLKESGLNQSAEVTSPNLEETETPITGSSTLTAATESPHDLDRESELLPSPTMELEEPAKASTVQEVGLTETLLGLAGVDNEDSISVPAETQMQEETENKNSISGRKSGPPSLKQRRLSSPKLTHAKLSALPISDPNMGKNIRKNYLLCNRVRVYSSFPEMEFSEGMTVLQISDNEWVAISLEFPNEERK